MSPRYKLWLAVREANRSRFNLYDAVNEYLWLLYDRGEFELSLISLRKEGQMTCGHCGSENMLTRQKKRMGFKSTICLDCNHEHFGQTVYHDRWCCDMVFRKGGGAQGSTEASRSRHAEALEAREAASKAPPVGE